MRDSEIANQTGIPRITITRVRLETRTLPSMYDAPLRNAYQREAYSRLFDAGASSYEARRFSWYSPSRNRELVEKLNRRVIDYAGGAAAARINTLTSEGKPIVFESVFQEEIQRVKEGIKRSRAPLEEILEGT